MYVEILETGYLSQDTVHDSASTRNFLLKKRESISITDPFTRMEAKQACDVSSLPHNESVLRVCKESGSIYTADSSTFFSPESSDNPMFTQRMLEGYLQDTMYMRSQFWPYNVLDNTQTNPADNTMLQSSMGSSFSPNQTRSIDATQNEHITTNAWFEHPTILQNVTCDLNPQISSTSLYPHVQPYAHPGSSGDHKEICPTWLKSCFAHPTRYTLSTIKDKQANSIKNAKILTEHAYSPRNLLQWISKREIQYISYFPPRLAMFIFKELQLSNSLLDPTRQANLWKEGEKHANECSIWVATRNSNDYYTKTLRDIYWFAIKCDAAQTNESSYKPRFIPRLSLSSSEKEVCYFGCSCIHRMLLLSLLSKISYNYMRFAFSWTEDNPTLPGNTTQASGKTAVAFSRFRYSSMLIEEINTNLRYGTYQPLETRRLSTLKFSL